MSLAKNTAYSFFGSVLPILISLVSVPLYLRHIGLERYGVVALCWLLLGYLGLFDFGLGRAISQRMAAMRHAEPSARSSVFWVGLFSSLGLGVAAALISFPLLVVALDEMKFSSAAMQAEVHRAIPILALTLPVTLVSGVFTGALLGRERFGILSSTDVLTGLLSTLLPLMVALTIGPDLTGLIAATLLGRLVSTSIVAIACIRGVPLRRPTAAPPGTLRSLLAYGGWVSATNVVGPILSFVDRFVIGGLLSASAVSIYTIPFNLVMRLTILPEALSRALFPRYAVASEDEAAELCRTGVAAISVIVSPMAIIMIGAMATFLRLWVGTAVAAPATQVGCLLIPGYWLNCFALIAYNQLHAQGRPDIPAKLHMAEIIPFIGLLYAAVHWFGLPGAAAVWTLRTSLDAVLMFRFSAARLHALRALPVPLLVIWAMTLVVLNIRLSLPEMIVLTMIVTLGVLAIVFRSAPDPAKAMVHRLVDRLRSLVPIKQRPVIE